MKRRKISSRKSKKMFRNTANRSHRKNSMRTGIGMRGGRRL